MATPVPRSYADIARTAASDLMGMCSPKGYRDAVAELVDAAPRLADALDVTEARVAEVERELTLLRATIANYGDALTRVGGR